MVVSSLRDFEGDCLLFPAMNRWATSCRPSGTSSDRRISNLYSAWPKKVFHQLYQDDILIFVMRRLEQSRVYATSQQGQSLQLQYLWTGFFRFSVNLQDLKFYAHRT